MSSDSNATSVHVLLGGVVLLAAGMILAIFQAPGIIVPPTSPAPVASSTPAGMRSARVLSAAAGQTAVAPDDTPRMITAYAAEGLRDPMMSLLPTPKSAKTVAASASEAGATTAGVAASAEPVAPSVQGLVWGGGHSQALIDGKLYQVGQMIGQAKILAITHDGVTVSIRDMHHLWQPVRPLQVSATPPATGGLIEGGQP